MHTEVTALVQVWRWLLGCADVQLLLACGFFSGRGKHWASTLTIDLVVTLQSNKVPVVQPSHAVHPLTPLITYSDEHFSPGSHPSHIPSDVNSKQGESPACQASSHPRGATSHQSAWPLLHVTGKSIDL